MKRSTALAYYGSAKALAEAAGVKPQAVSQWREHDRVPIKRALYLQTKTKGELTVLMALYAVVPPKRRTRV